MKVKILSFGLIADIIDTQVLELDENMDTQDLISILNKKYPKLEHNNYAISVNHKLITNKVKLNDHDEIALLPPFSGG